MLHQTEIKEPICSKGKKTIEVNNFTYQFIFAHDLIHSGQNPVFCDNWSHRTPHLAHVTPSTTVIGGLLMLNDLIFTKLVTLKGYWLLQNILLIICNFSSFKLDATLVVDGLRIFVAIVEGIIAIIASGMACRSTCCNPTQVCNYKN